MEDKLCNSQYSADKDEEDIISKNKLKRGKKRKRITSDSGSGTDDGLPENALEVEKNLIASAVKNNLDDVSVKKILKKVVTNDHVLAFVKLREEEESSTEESNFIPKRTRSRIKELSKVSPKSATWNLQNLELTPIKHIPVKTRPEVKALIAQELPEDEDDEEYEPTHEDVQSDDDQTLESCSDLDSQPRTPATPRSNQKSSPKVIKDGPFKVPQDISTPARRKLELEEEATIALRTRSKLCLSETPIEHIESSFVPPDELVPVVDDHLWNDFLNECLNPASVSKHEDDDETDPEYNVAADPDAPDDEDEEAMERSILKISKKELNDLVTELFNIMPEQSVDDELANISDGVIENPNNQSSSRWEGKQEPVSDEETSVKMVDRIVFERRSSITKLSVGKMEPEDVYECGDNGNSLLTERTEPSHSPPPEAVLKGPANVVEVVVEEQDMTANNPPPTLRFRISEPSTHRLQILLENGNTILPEQVQILQQQLRQHIQIATSNFLQLYVHPAHWTLGPTYKDYLATLMKMANTNPKSVVNVCNLKPAMELVESWEKSVSEDTPENAKMVEFIQKEVDRSRRRIATNSLYVGSFHETLQRTVANSCVFLYPFLLPPVPYRVQPSRRFTYMRAEDELIALGLDQFWEYVENNPELYPKPARPNPRHRWGLTVTAELIVKHMMPWLSPKIMLGHIQSVRRAGDKDNPIHKFFVNREVTPVRHRLLPFNPALTLYEQPEHEMPRNWIRYLAKTSKRFRSYLHRRTNVTGQTPAGVEVNLGQQTEVPAKAPLHIDFTKEILANRLNTNPPTIKPLQTDRFDLRIEKPNAQNTPPNLFRVIQTSKGIGLVPCRVVQPGVDHLQSNTRSTNTVNCNVTPIISSVEVKKEVINTNNNLTNTNKEVINTNKKVTSTIKEVTNNMKQVTNTIKEVKRPNGIDASNCCKCCVKLRSINKRTVITDYFRSNRINKKCHCTDRKYPKITQRLRLLVDRYKLKTECVYRDLKKKIDLTNGECGDSERSDLNGEKCYSLSDEVFVTAYQLKLTLRAALAKNIYIKQKIFTLFSTFDPDEGDPGALARELEKILDVEMVDVFIEFIGFLTPEQAESLGRFREYFTLNCVEDVMKKVEEHVKSNDSRREILKQIGGMFSGKRSACSICSHLLTSVRRYPELAKYIFDLFPHTIPIQGTNEKPEGAVPFQEAVQEEHKDLIDDTLTNGDAYEVADYEADHSSNGEEDSDSRSTIATPKLIVSEGAIHIKMELSPDRSLFPQPTMCKIEPTDYDSSDMSMMIMSEDEPIKSEPPDWKRDEDKLILEVLKANLPPEERKDKTIIEILEEKQVIETLSQNLISKSKEEVRGRMMYLLNILLLGET